MLRQIGFGEDGGADPQRPAAVPRLRLSCANISPSRASFSASTSSGLDKVMPRLDAKTFDVIFIFDEVNPRLAAAVRPRGVLASTRRRRSTCSRRRSTASPSTTNQHEYPVVADRSHPLDYEVNRAPQRVRPHSGLAARRRRSRRSIPPPPGSAAAGLCYTVRRLPRRRTAHESANTGASPTTPAPKCFCRSASAPIPRTRSASPSSACARCAPTGIWPSACRSARAAPTSGCSTT